jgi:HAE1 family hydrophobic/amphiphilic exporter-1
MWISDASIRNPTVTTVVVLALALFGAISLLRLETDEFPEVEPPIVGVSIPYPGAAPGTVEREVIDPLEESFASMSGLDKIESTSFDGFALLTVTFLFGKDLKEATQDIRDKISEKRQDLPPEMEEPVLTRFDPGDLPIVSLTLSSRALTPAALTRLCDPGIKRALESVTGVAQVKVVGGVEPELTVELEPRALEAAGLGVSQIVAALEAQNLAAPVGRLTDSRQERTIRLRGRLPRPEDFAALIVSPPGAPVLRLGDVARVYAGAEEARSLALFNSEPAVGIDVVKATEGSTTTVAAAIREKVAALRATLPPGVELRVVRDAGVRVARSVHDVERSLLEGAALTVLVVFAFLASWRSTVITGLALPVSVLASFIAVKAFGFTLNTMSLLGLSLAIGILIDDAIVVRENIVRHMEMGKDHLRAAREGTAEIGLAVAATTFSIVVVFVPTAFMGGLAQQWFAPFALTIACSVLVSLLVSFSLDPMLSAHWADPEVEGGHKSWLTRRLDRFNAWLGRQTARYRRLVAWALHHPWIMVAVAVGSFALAVALPAAGLVGSAFFPIEDRSEFLVHLETPPGSSLEQTRRKVLSAVRLASARPEVEYTYTTIGGQGEVVDEATIYVRLVPRDRRARSQDAIATSLRDDMKTVAGVTASLMTGGFGPQKQIQLQLTGPDSRVLGRLADQLAAAARQVPGAVDVGLSTKGQKPEMEVVLDRGLAGTLGVTASQVAQALRPAFAGLDAGDWVDPAGETRDVTLRLAPAARVSPADIARLPLLVARPGAPGGQAIIPLGQVAAIEQGLGPALINHLDGRKVIIVGANTEGRPLNQVVADLERRVRGLHLPPGYQVTQGGETESQREVFGRIVSALLVAVLLMYFILVIQFRSFLDPVPIMASLPLSLVGVMLALLFTGSTVNIMSLIGVILLVGLVAKNAILLIDFAKWAEARGLDRREAIVEAGGVRLRPILMTSVAIVAGMIPVALGTGEGGDFRAPLGRAVIGGVITSTLLTLLVIPTFYLILANGRDRALRALRRRRHRPAAPAPAPSGG